MSTPLRSARSIQQKLLTSKEAIRSVISYCTYRKDDRVCSDKDLEKKLKQVDRELGRLLEYVQSLESQSRRIQREERLKQESEKR
mgnify:CR=1|jgi:hypothetical protein